MGASVCVTSYNAYNRGACLDKWYDIDEVTYQQIYDEVLKKESDLGINDSGEVELMCTYYENFPKNLYDEAFSESVYEQIEFFEEANEVEKCLIIYCLDYGMKPDEIDQKALDSINYFVGDIDEYVEDMINDIVIRYELPDYVRDYISSDAVRTANEYGTVEVKWEETTLVVWSE